jgi:pre-mRNA-processing factor SLU7
MASKAPPSHVTETIADRKKSRELAEARQSGAVAPAVDVKTGNMINPHNPEFITKRPWYLGSNDDGPSLDHQSQIQSQKSLELSLNSAHQLVQTQRKVEKEARKKGNFQVGMWVEAMKHGKGPYKICQIIKISKKGKLFDLKYEDNNNDTVERNVKFKTGGMFKPRIRMTVTGARAAQVDEKTFGKETYDSKRDKYHGYDQDTHTAKVSRVFQDREDLRTQLREKEKKQDKNDDDNDNNNNNNKGSSKDKNKKDTAKDNASDSDSDVDDDGDSEDEFVQKDEDERVITTRLARQGGVGGAQMKVTARNLRIREDTAKYLRNLDPNSAYYDPKSRSMRDNPNPSNNTEQSQFVGDNFARISGDAVQFAETQLFAWDAAEKAAVSASSLHPQANPSQVEVLKKKFQSKSAELQLQKKKKVLDKYGGSEYLDGTGGLANAVDDNDDDDNNKKQSSSSTKNATTAAQDRKIRFGVSTSSIEYTRDGRVVKGGATTKRVAQKSKYDEDVYQNGHTTVFGSYFHMGGLAWGYADDHSLIKNSYATGANGRIANDQANEMQHGTGVAGSAALAQARGMLKAIPSKSSAANNNNEPSSRSKMYGEADQKAELDAAKVREALKKQQQEEEEEKDLKKKKRKYNSMDANVDVTEEEMEAYRLHKGRGADPMSKIATDEVLEYKK